MRDGFVTSTRELLLYLCLCLSYSLTPTLSLSLALSLSLSLSLSLALSPSFSLSVALFPVSLPLFRFSLLSFTLFLSLPLGSLSLSLSLLLSSSLFHKHSLSVRNALSTNTMERRPEITFCFIRRNLRLRTATRLCLVLLVAYCDFHVACVLPITTPGRQGTFSRTTQRRIQDLVRGRPTSLLPHPNWGPFQSFGGYSIYCETFFHAKISL